MAAAVALTNDCIKDGNAVEATSKAAASAWRSSQVPAAYLSLPASHLLAVGRLLMPCLVLKCSLHLSPGPVCIYCLMLF